LEYFCLTSVSIIYLFKKDKSAPERTFTNTLLNCSLTW